MVRSVLGGAPRGKGKKRGADLYVLCSALAERQKIRPVLFTVEQKQQLRELGCTKYRCALLESCSTEWRGLNRSFSAVSVKDGLASMGYHAHALESLLSSVLEPLTADAIWSGPAASIQALLGDAMGDVHGEEIGELIILRNALARFSGNTAHALGTVHQSRGIRTRPFFFDLVAGYLSAKQ